MVEFQVSNEIFMGFMAMLIIPVILWVNRSFGKVMEELRSLVVCVQNQQKAYDNHIIHADIETEKLNALSSAVQSHTLLIDRLQKDIDGLESREAIQKGSPF